MPTGQNRYPDRGGVVAVTETADCVGRAVAVGWSVAVAGTTCVGTAATAASFSSGLAVG
ncbi:MAG: hypothetical protein R3C44_17350 [Chloroflexota bacterium]